MGVILDTCIWVEVERGRLAPMDVAEITREEPVYLAAPVIAELEYGVNRAGTDAQRQKRAAALARVRRKPCLVIDAETGSTFGRLSAALESSGKPSAHRVNDLWLASLAVQHNLAVLTLNPRDFADIPGLRLLSLPPRHRAPQ